MPAENMTTTMPAENMTTTMPAENMTTTMPAENMTTTMPEKTTMTSTATAPTNATMTQTSMASTTMGPTTPAVLMAYVMKTANESVVEAKAKFIGGMMKLLGTNATDENDLLTFTMFKEESLPSFGDIWDVQWMFSDQANVGKLQMLIMTDSTAVLEALSAEKIMAGGEAAQTTELQAFVSMVEHETVNMAESRFISGFVNAYKLGVPPVIFLQFSITDSSFGRVWNVRWIWSQPDFNVEFMKLLKEDKNKLLKSLSALSLTVDGKTFTRSKSHSHGLAGWKIAVIVIFVILGVALMSFAAFRHYMNKRAAQQSPGTVGLLPTGSQ